MRRRDLALLIGGAALAWPVAARAEEGALPVVGYLGSIPVDTVAANTIRKGLAEEGVVEGRDVTIEYRVADTYGRLPAVAAELVAARVAVIIVSGSAAAAVAAKNATSTIPIVFVSGIDPVKLGLVSSL